MNGRACTLTGCFTSSYLSAITSLLLTHAGLLHFVASPILSFCCLRSRISVFEELGLRRDVKGLRSFIVFDSAVYNMAKHVLRGLLGKPVCFPPRCSETSDTDSRIPTDQLWSGSHDPPVLMKMFSFHLLSPFIFLISFSSTLLTFNHMFTVLLQPCHKHAHVSAPVSASSSFRFPPTPHSLIAVCDGQNKLVKVTLAQFILR